MRQNLKGTSQELAAEQKLTMFSYQPFERVHSHDRLLGVHHVDSKAAAVDEDQSRAT